MLEHVGMLQQSRKLSMALDMCAIYEKKSVITGRPDGATASQFGDEVISALRNPRLEANWKSYQKM